MRVFCFIALCGIAGAAFGAETLETFSGRTMGTTFRVKYVAAANHPPAADVQRDVKMLLDGLERMMSDYRADSAVSRFNASRNTNWFAVSAELAGVVAEAQRISRLTDGAFDITTAPLVRLWGFGPERRSVSPPTDEAIQQARRHVGFVQLIVRAEPPALRKSDAQLAMDLGGIGKGFAADKVGELLERRGITNYLAGIAGEQRARGVNDSGRPWQLGIEQPAEDARGVAAVVELADRSLSTSGDYRNFIERDGVSQSHLIDPRTGRPVGHTLASVSVVHTSGAATDALATALMVLGPDAGMAFAERERLACLFIVRHEGRFELLPTSAMKPLLRR